MVVETRAIPLFYNLACAAPIGPRSGAFRRGNFGDTSDAFGSVIQRKHHNERRRGSVFRSDGGARRTIRRFVGARPDGDVHATELDAIRSRDENRNDAWDAGWSVGTTADFEVFIFRRTSVRPS